MIHRMNVARYGTGLLSIMVVGVMVSSVGGQQAEVRKPAISAAPVLTQKKDDEPLLRSFMRQKLDASNKILEGLVTDDLAMVEQGADTLLKMSTEAKWRASNDMLYRRYSTEFVDAVSDMKEKAKAQSIDGTSLAWINSTMTCLKCHEWVRNTIVAKNGDASLRSPDDAELRKALVSAFKAVPKP